MDYRQFAETIEELAPNHKPDAIRIWKNFAAECVDRGQFVHFEALADKEAAVERWLDILAEGFRAVSKSFGHEAAGAVVNLSCEHCCIYPGEMMQAAVYLKNGYSSKQILAMIESGEIDSSNLFHPMSQQGAETDMSHIFTGSAQTVLGKVDTAMPRRECKTEMKDEE